MILIRPYQSDDKEAIIRLWLDCGLVVAQNDPRLDIERKLKVNAEWFLVGEDAGEVVATCMAGYEGHRGWINYLAVAPLAQRKGIALLMMGEAERLLRDAGCPKINLQIRATNKVVMQFYESIGFKVDDVVCMGKRLQVDKQKLTQIAAKGFDEPKSNRRNDRTRNRIS